MINKTILLVIEGDSAEQDFLESGFLNLLKDKFKKVIVLAQQNKIEFFKEKYSSYNVVFDEMPKIFDSWVKKKFFNILRYSIHTKTARLRLMRNLFNRQGFKFSSWVVFFWPAIISWELSKFKFWRLFLRKLYNLLSVNKKCLDLLKENNVDVIYADYTPIAIKDFNLKLLRAGKKLCILTIGNIISWDQLTSKTFIPFHTDFLFVHNKKIKQEAIEIWDFEKDKIRITGIPRFDFYKKTARGPALGRVSNRNVFSAVIDKLISNNRKEIFLSKQEFFKQIGADINKKFIVFAGGLREFDIDYDYFFNLFADLTKFQLADTQFYLRPYPELPFSQELKIKYGNSRHLIFEKPTNKRTHLLANLFFHSDILICIYSTLMLEACLLDLPIINLSYFPNSKQSYFYKPERQLEKEHLKNIFNNNSAKMVRNDKEMLSAIKAYLRNPRLDKEQRKTTAKEQMFELNGRASQNIIDQLVKIC